MHDSAIAEGIVEAVKGYAGLKTVYVLVGMGSCLRANMLESSFDLLKRGTSAASARLVVVNGPGDEVRVLSVELDQTV